MRKLNIILVIISFFVANLLYAESKKDEIARTIVRVGSDNKYSTGFFWKNGKNIVTTMHSIANKENINIWINSSNNQLKCYKASINRVFKEGDLVLLDLIGFESKFYINEASMIKPKVDSKVFTIGYYSDNFNYIDRDFDIGYLQGGHLQNLLPQSAQDNIRRLTFPSLQLEIIYLKGQLLHGFSGSPIVNYNGDLIGIADGGLENGAAGISWCITVQSLFKLEQSTEHFPSIDQNKLEELFSSDIYVSTGPVSIGEFKFQKVKTRKFSDLDKTANYTTYKEMGLYQLLNMMQVSGIQYNDFIYDIYIEQKTGATLVIPAGMELKETDGMFYATSSDGKNIAHIKVSITDNIQRESVLFEQNIPYLTNIFSWNLDQRLSFLMPLIRPDNVIINRKGFYSLQPNNYIFEVLAGKETIFFGIYILMENSINPQNLGFINPTESAKYNLAAQLSTFTN